MKRFILLCGLSIMLFYSCRMTEDIAIIELTGGYVFGEGNEIYLEYEIIEPTDPPTTIAGGGTDTSYLFPSSIDNALSLDGFVILEAGFGKLTLDDPISSDAGDTVAINVSTSEDIGTAIYWGVPFLVYNVYDFSFSIDQQDTIEIDNQFYLIAPQFSESKYDMFLEFPDLPGYKKIEILYPSQENRISFWYATDHYLDLQPQIQFEEINTGNLWYLNSGGALVSSPAYHDESVLFSPGVVYDLSGLIIPDP